MPAWLINTPFLEYGRLLSMLAFTGKYGIDDLNLNKYTHTRSPPPPLAKK